MARLSYFLLGLLIFALINIPPDCSNHWRASVASALSPAWQAFIPYHSKSENISGSEIEALQSQVNILNELLQDEKRLQSQSEALTALVEKKDAEALQKNMRLRAAHAKELLLLQYQSVPARVVFREPSSWSSAIWISVGNADNRALERIVVAQNSPVLANQSLVGVVEYVGETQSRVRLISDAGMACAVRAIRGGMQNREVIHHVQNLLTHVEVRPDLFASPEEQNRFVDMLSAFKYRFKETEDEMLAKGEICGCSAPLFRSRSTTLKGTGFNYDFSDEEGPARDLRSGMPIGKHCVEKKALIQQGDLLATSGFDGVFPAGIPVAIVTAVAPLKEGGYTYEIEAKPAAGDLMDLQTVFVLPATGINAKVSD